MVERGLSKDEVSQEEIIRTKLDSPGVGFDRWWLLVLAVIVLIVILVMTSPDPYQRALIFVSDGIKNTILVTGVSFLLIVVLGLIGGLGRISKNKLISGIATIYVEVVRGVPLMVQILAWYFAFPAIVQNLGTTLNSDALKNYFANPVATAIMSLTICYGAYMSEIYRAGIQSITKGQMEAARSLGMTQVQAMRYVILPQAVRVILPPMGNEFISLLKDSSLVSVVAVEDLTRRGREFMAQTATPIETWTIVALLYLVMTILSARVVNWIEKKTKLAER
jgi:polar amino acid transport system permease protein